MLEKEIQLHSEHPILIDVVPNMKFLSRKGSLVRDCEGEMRQFELGVSIYNLLLYSLLKCIVFACTCIAFVCA